eukprot:COSAG02_NODE_31795_length_527_cov_0.845794_1_plen_101_part_10
MPAQDGPTAPAADSSAPSITAEEHHALSKLLLSELQHTRSTYDQVWSAVHRNARDKSDRLGDISVEELTSMYEESVHRVRPWRELYTPVEPERWATAEEIK